MPRRSWPALLLLIAFAPVLRAQSTNASLNGRITDPVKAVIVKANVAAINLGVPGRETIIELTYRLDLRKGAYFIQPDLQYINRSGSAGQFKNALVLSAQFGINF